MGSSHSNREGTDFFPELWGCLFSLLYTAQLQPREKHNSCLCRCDSWSNSDRSLEQTSSDDVFVDSLQSQPSLYLVQPSSTGTVHQDGAPLANPNSTPRNVDISGPPSDFSSSSPLLGTPLTPTFQIDKSQNALPYGVTQLDVLSNTPPPRPPKPTHFSDRRGDEVGGSAFQNGHAICRAQVALVPRRISLSSLDNMRNWKGECISMSYQSKTGMREGAAHKHRVTAHLQLCLPVLPPANSHTAQSSLSSLFQVS